ncbi:restriction endonuclease subunit S [Flavobacterium sp. j3]|uniref:Restriction endonuclease subunit S n=1 Tax=Flavobacterium aureirubrum TaxID=3133147 RepID=A0ABU9NAZ0_9FLAO
MDNKVPKSWQIKTLNDVSKKLSLNKLKIKQKEYLPSGLFPVIDQGQDLIGGYYNDESLLVSDEPPYIIFGDHTKIKKYITFKFIPGADGVKVLKAKENILPKFLFYLLFTIKIEDKGYARHFQLLEKESFLVPNDIETQQAIVSKIEELFSELDKGIEDLKTAQQQLKTYRQSVLKWAFEGKLTNENLKEGELPKSWEWTTFQKVCIKIGDIDHKMPKQLDKGYPYVSTKDFTNDLKISFDNAKYISEEDYLNLSRKIKPEKGDIIFPRYGTIGKNILVDFDKEFLVSYSCAVIKPNHDIVLSKYIYLFSLSPKITDEIRKYVVETTQANIGIASIKSFVFPIPPMEEQCKVVDELESRLSVADKMEESITQSLQQAEALRQSILKKAFSGELV